MKKLIPLLLLAGNALADTTVTINLHGVASNEGQLVVTAFDSKKNWLKRPFATTTVSAADVTDDGVLIAVLELPPGDYAINAYHDLDSNGKMKTNFIGIPKEPTGVSNDAKGRFGPPKFKDAVLLVTEEPRSVEINLVQI